MELGDIAIDKQIIWLNVRLVCGLLNVNKFCAKLAQMREAQLQAYTHTHRSRYAYVCVSVRYGRLARLWHVK